MGAVCSNRCRRQATRDTLPLRQLRFLDIVLIRSKLLVSSVSLDARVAAGVRATTSGIILSNQTVRVPKWDRVGVIRLPERGEPNEYDYDNISVIEATHAMVHTISLRQVFDTAIEVCVRQLVYSPPLPVDDVSPRASMRSQRMSGDDEDEWRQKIKSLFYGFSGAVVRKPYSHPLCVDALQPMFQFVARHLKPLDLGPQEVELKAVLDRYDIDPLHPGQLSQDGVLQIFRELAKHPKLENTFSDAETFQLRNEFTESAGRNFLPRETFEKFWRDSMRRALASRKHPRETISGAFVSLCLQKVGVFHNIPQRRVSSGAVAAGTASADPATALREGKGEKKAPAAESDPLIAAAAGVARGGSGAAGPAGAAGAVGGGGGGGGGGGSSSAAAAAAGGAAFALPMDFAATSSSRLRPGGKVLELFADPFVSLGPECIILPPPIIKATYAGSDPFDE